MKRFAICLAILSLGYVSNSLFAQPVVPGFDVDVYATVTDPQLIEFDSAGNLYVGRDNSGSGGGLTDPVKIHRISPGGTTVVEYGDASIMDPDAVVVDRAGVFGTPGAVLVGGIISNSDGGHIKSILPDQTVINLFGPTTDFHNPTHFAFDNSGRLLFTNAANFQTPTNRGIFVSSSAGQNPIPIYETSTNLIGLAVDDLDRIFVSTEDGVIQIHQSDGSLENDSFVTGLGIGGPLVFGEFGNSNTNLFTFNVSGELLCIDPATGAWQIIGTGFENAGDFAFGPDGALYVSQFDNDRIIRIGPGTTVTASSFNIFRGILGSGTLASTHASDDDYLKLSPGITLSSAEPPVWIEFDGTLPLHNPGIMSVTLEASANTVGLTQTIEMFNWNTGQYEQVDLQSASFNNDSVVTKDLTVSFANYFENGTGHVKTRTGSCATGPILMFPWTICIDRVDWSWTN